MHTQDTADTLHRLVKHAIDSGAAASLAQAEAIFRSYSLTFEIAPPQARDPQCQATLLTGVALARRVFLGGVSVTGAVEAPLLVPMPLGASLGEGIVRLGGSVGQSVPNSPRITVGGGPAPRGDGFHVRTICAGWRGGIVPAYCDAVADRDQAIPPAAMLSAALAVNEAFLYTTGEVGAAGRRRIGLSLWHPSADSSWLVGSDVEPNLRYLPSQLWLIGLGHLGQAYLWGLGLLPYPNSPGLALVLQDVDVLTPSSESTSILTDRCVIGQKKTRAMAAWAERRGFTTSIHERLFDTSFRRQESEPAIALCGVDNAKARRALEAVGFDLVIEAGLGRGYRDFRSIRLHTLPGSRPAYKLWKGDGSPDDLAGRPAYQKMLRDGSLDQCGITLLSGKAVGAPFVGAVAACLALSEVLRLLHGGPLHSVIELDLQSIDQLSAVVTRMDFSHLNPGFILA